MLIKRGGFDKRRLLRRLVSFRMEGNSAVLLFSNRRFNLPLFLRRVVSVVALSLILVRFLVSPA